MILDRGTSFLSVNILLFAFFFILSFSLSAQHEVEDTLWLSDEWYYSLNDSAIIDAAEFLPNFLQYDIKLKRYLRDERFFDLRRRLNDTLAVDAIYDRSMLLTNGNIAHALLISTFAVMDHRRLGIKIPLIGPVYIPLTWENDSLFKRRRTHLPKKLLDDNPKASDKDKLQHFFGSAYISYITNSGAIGKWLGDLLELGEDRFVLGGREDERDKLANEKGREFGLRLLKEYDLLPSDVLWSRE